MKNELIIISIILACILLAGSAQAGSSLFYKEINLIGGYSDNQEWVGKSAGLRNSVGFEDYRKFSNDYGDFLTTDLQVRATYDSLEDSDDAWALEVHNAWLEYKLAYGYNLIAGHFDPAFGLETVLDTHGTILQTLAKKNIGFKKDWGIGMRGSLDKFDYNIGLQLGSGMSIRRRDGNFLITARLGTPQTEDLQVGASILYGDLLMPDGTATLPRTDLLFDKAVSKKRIGVDGQYRWNSLLFKGEVAYGKDDDDEVLGYLAELDYTIPTLQNLQLEIQLSSWMNDMGNRDLDDSTIAAGASYKVNKDVTLRAAYFHDLNLKNGNEDDRVLLQFYYFG